MFAIINLKNTTLHKRQEARLIYGVFSSLFHLSNHQKRLKILLSLAKILFLAKRQITALKPEKEIYLYKMAKKQQTLLFELWT